MKRRPLDGNARSLEPDTQLGENIVNEALIARVVCQPVQNVAVRMGGDGIDVRRRVHILLLSSDLDRRYRICRACIGLSEGTLHRRWQFLLELFPLDAQLVNFDKHPQQKQLRRRGGNACLLKLQHFLALAAYLHTSPEQDFDLTVSFHWLPEKEA